MVGVALGRGESGIPESPDPFAPGEAPIGCAPAAAVDTDPCRPCSSGHHMNEVSGIDAVRVAWALLCVLHAPRLDTMLGRMMRSHVGVWSDA